MLLGRFRKKCYLFKWFTLLNFQKVQFLLMAINASYFLLLISKFKNFIFAYSKRKHKYLVLLFLTCVYVLVEMTTTKETGTEKTLNVITIARRHHVSRMNPVRRISTSRMHLLEPRGRMTTMTQLRQRGRLGTFQLLLLTNREAILRNEAPNQEDMKSQAKEGGGSTRITLQGRLLLIGRFEII